MNIVELISNELTVKSAQVDAVIHLLDDGATVPFIARYRKEVTGGLTDDQLRQLVERLQYLRELEERKQTVLTTIEKQDKLTDELKAKIIETDNKAQLEDIYLPYKPKRRTKAQIAKEAGLEPLAESLLLNPLLNPNSAAEKYINTECGINDAVVALDGAQQILMEKFSEDAELLGQLRGYLWKYGLLEAKVKKDKETEGVKFSDYFDFRELANKIPSHRALALFRGRNEGFLHVSVVLSDDKDSDYCCNLIAEKFGVKNSNRPADGWLWQAVEWAWKIKLYLKLETDLLLKIKEQADEEAIKVFASNLENLLLAAPAGNKATLGLDPGLRTGVKVVVIDGTGKLLEYITIFPHVPRNEWSKSLQILQHLCSKYQVELISIGNGTASRETDRLAADLIKQAPQLKLTKIVVSEAGASVYSASELASKEFPDLDVTYRGAVSIARRLQDPLAELVKIDPKSIGVGQYQHDVNQVRLGKMLAAVMEDCVNAVGADVNTASVPLLATIAGLNERVAKNIVTFREKNGRFNSRNELKKVSSFGEKTYEQAIGFLRIIGGDNLLDASAVHPESYPVVEKIIEKSGKSLNEIMANSKFLATLNPRDYIDEKFGLPTVKDIIAELEKPGRDPRPEFKAAQFKEGVETIDDLQSGMTLEGVVTNVANFGAFVDIGVHQDGLVHVSEIANKFVSDPRTVLKVGQIVTVMVKEIDKARKRIQLTMKTDSAPDKSGKIHKQKKVVDAGNSLLADKLKAALKS